MTVAGSSEKRLPRRFNKIAGKRLSADLSIKLSTAPLLPPLRTVRLTSAVSTRARTGFVLLGVNEAIRLRDWLDRVLP